jgi:glycosyltransferase involved in cell wall biosynthesis
MKILHIIPNLKKGGAERLVIDIVRELAKRENTNVKLVIFHNAIEYDISDIKQLVYHIPASIRLSVWKKNIIEVNTLQLFINDFQPDVIHSHLFEAEIVSRSCYYPKSKWFSHCHSNIEQLANPSLRVLFSKSMLTNFYERGYLMQRYQINSGNTFIAISESTITYIRKVVRKYKATLLPNAIDYKKFSQPMHTVSETLRLINVGAINRNKNQIFLIEAAHKLKVAKVPFQLKIIGFGCNMELLLNRISQLELQESVHLIGLSNNVDQELCNADIYVHSAKTEAFGLTQIEAMAAGLPVITLDGGGNRDIIKQGKNGYMIYEENAEDFAQKIIEVWSDKALYESMSQFATSFASKFDISQYVDKLLVIYNEATKH